MKSFPPAPTTSSGSRRAAISQNTAPESAWIAAPTTRTADPVRRWRWPCARAGRSRASVVAPKREGRSVTVDRAYRAAYWPDEVADEVVMRRSISTVPSGGGSGLKCMTSLRIDPDRLELLPEDRSVDRPAQLAPQPLVLEGAEVVAEGELVDARRASARRDGSRTVEHVLPVHRLVDDAAQQPVEVADERERRGERVVGVGDVGGVTTPIGRPVMSSTITNPSVRDVPDDVEQVGVLATGLRLHQRVAQAGLGPGLAARARSTPT